MVATQRANRINNNATHPSGRITVRRTDFRIESAVSRLWRRSSRRLRTMYHGLARNPGKPRYPNRALRTLRQSARLRACSPQRTKRRYANEPEGGKCIDVRFIRAAFLARVDLGQGGSSALVAVWCEWSMLPLTLLSDLGKDRADNSHAGAEKTRKREMKLRSHFGDGVPESNTTAPFRRCELGDRFKRNTERVINPEMGRCKQQVLTIATGSSACFVG